MTLPVYMVIGRRYCPVGTLTISYDRIAQIALYIPRTFAVRWTIEREAHIEWCNKTGETFQTHNIYKEDTDYKFTIKKLSKAEIPYRKAKLTHQIMSNDLKNRIKSQLFTNISRAQMIKVKYSTRKLVWQTQEFKKHIYFHIATNIASAILGIIGTILVLKGCGKNKGQEESLNKTTIYDTATKKGQPLPGNKTVVSDASNQDTLWNISDTSGN